MSQAAGSRPATKPPRHLHEIGRQSSSDSGIATCSHSSYSGSFSSYTGSLDINSGEEFGSVFSLPPHLAQGLSPCSCQTVSGHEYQVPSSLRYLYDSSQSVLPEGRVDMESEPSTRTADAVALLDLTVELKVDESSVTTCEARETELISEHSVGLSEDSKNNEALSSSGRPDSCHIYNSVTSASKTIVAICSVCGGVRVSKVPYIESLYLNLCWPSLLWATFLLNICSVESGVSSLWEQASSSLYHLLGG